jgi:hypothetical protein
MPLLSREKLQEMRDTGLRPVGGRTLNEGALDLSTLPAGNLQSRLERLDVLLKEHWNHYEDLRILSAIEDLALSPNTRTPNDLVYQAASYVYQRDRGTFHSPRRNLEQELAAYESLRYRAAERLINENLPQRLSHPDKVTRPSLLPRPQSADRS